MIPRCQRDTAHRTQSHAHEPEGQPLPHEEPKQLGGSGTQGSIEREFPPPLPRPVRPAYRVLFEAAVTTLPPRILSILDLPVRPGARRAGLASVGFLRWALGSSPSWLLALDRVGAPIPPGLFRQPLPSGKPSVLGSVGQ